ncbi:MAG: hypothetical protein ABH824_07455 [Nanoarchaeota archaeon]|nr:hypothetical protein [Nanoarchaeota archaeon]MBU1632268.1 hypothetical protein [Nanoarchaeota archaeon]MBU1876037.1 hypothetical protein [Nanoarchaeota archaeon]
MGTNKRLMLVLLKDFTIKQTITSIAKELKLSRVGIWKILKKLEAEKYILIESVGSGKTSTSIIKINWDNLLVEKALAFYLTEESIKQRRWRVNFAELENEVDFLLLYGSIVTSTQQADDIDIVGIAKKNKFVKIQKILDKIQKTESKKIHLIDFIVSEFRKELQNNNKAFIDAIKKGVILFGQENFVKFMKEMSK